MLRIRCGSVVKTASVAVSALVFWLMVAADTAFGDDLRGYSIDASYTTQTVAGAVIAGNIPRHGFAPVMHHDRIYVSVRGNVFLYTESTGGAYSAHGESKIQLDKAAPMSAGRMRAWTVEQDRLIRIEHQIEGNLVATFAIDPSRSTCTVTDHSDPDPKTGRMVMQLLSGQVMEIKAYDVRSATCVVRKGNLFAADQ